MSERQKIKENYRFRFRSNIKEHLGRVNKLTDHCTTLQEYLNKGSHSSVNLARSTSYFNNTWDQYFTMDQMELEQDQEWEWELNQYQWVLRYYVILSHCNGNWNWTGIGNLENGFPTHSGTYMVTLQGNLRCLVQ